MNRACIIYVFSIYHKAIKPESPFTMRWSSFTQYRTSEAGRGRVQLKYQNFFFFKKKKRKIENNTARHWWGVVYQMSSF